MNELTYLPVTDRNGNYFELGLLSDGQWFSVYASHGGDSINGYFTNKLDEITSIKVSVDAGTATFRKENSKYWYAYKKLKGKLNKVYIGSSDVFTELAIVTAVELANTPKSVTQNVCVTDTDKPSVELAGNKKDKNHIQQCLITENEAIAMANETIESLKEDVEGWQGSCELLEKLIATQKIQILSLKLSNADLEKKLYYEENLSLDNGCMTQSQADMNSDLIDELAAKQLTIDALEKALEEKEFDKNCCLTIYEKVSDRNQALSINLLNITTIIDKHRALTTGKTKQGHPRFNKLLEFLEDIDKDCLSI